ncbi:histidine triad nucleotide-binding protein [Bifidobacterium xylocopae]|uniref:Histidine triad nucleotide-binding protein n=1 Tax=Bifidobacterium xylocopae TaxID=2493119 RepID=A0A366KB70_9BIFI|nr:histidine triad nucleotide-binding protein [Bifidobacterium xylocopae]RBP98976.1 histidine triad nucleotide-binding protein [Bifidobacterium xylocopae]
MSESTRDEGCLFCRIVAGQVPSEKVYEDGELYAFKDVNPKAAVHVLIVPKRHYADVAELAAADPQLLGRMVLKAQDIADQAFHGAYRLIFNTGRDAGQSVFHVHAHVLTGEVMDE